MTATRPKTPDDWGICLFDLCKGVFSREGVCFAHIISGLRHDGFDFISDLFTTDATKHAGEPASDHRAPLIEQPNKYLSRVMNAREGDLCFSRVAIEKGRRYTDDCVFKPEHSQFVATCQVCFRWHRMLTKVVQR